MTILTVIGTGLAILEFFKPPVVVLFPPAPIYNGGAGGPVDASGQVEAGGSNLLKQARGNTCGFGGDVPDYVWGPMREMFSLPTNFPLLNQRLNSRWGDERAFYAVRDVTDSSVETEWYAELYIERDHVYELRIVVSNGAIPDNSLALTNARVMVSLPTCTGTWIDTSAYVKADNVDAPEVYRALILRSNEVFHLAYEPESARLCSRLHPCEGISGGLALSEDVFTSTGALVGTAWLNGEVLPGEDNSVIVSFRVHPYFASRA